MVAFPVQSTVAVGDPITAALWNDDVRDAVQWFLDSGAGKIAYNILGSQTDATGVTTLCTVSPTLTSGRLYLFTGNIRGTQITNTGTPTLKMLVAGTEVMRLWSTAVSLTATSVIWGSNSYLYAPGSTGAVTFSMTAQSTAAAFRTAVGDASIIIQDVGV